MARIATGLVGLLLVAAGNAWALPVGWDGIPAPARVVSVEMHNAEAAGPISTVAMGLTQAPQPGAVVLLGFGFLGAAVYSKRRRNTRDG